MKQFTGCSKEMYRKIHAPFTLPQCLTSSMTIGMDVSTIHRPCSDSITYTCTCHLFVSVCVVQCSFIACSFCGAATTVQIQNCSLTTCAVTLRHTYHLSLFQPLTCNFVISGGSYKWNHIISSIWGLAFLFGIIHFQSIQMVHVAIVHSFPVAEQYCIVCSPSTH